MGSKKHKKHKSERRERYEDPNLSPGRPPSLKLILKVGSNSTPEYGNDSPAYGVQNDQSAYLQELHERHKKSKKKKKKKDREKKHKHHHKEKRRHRDDSSFDESIGEDSQMQDIMRYAGPAKGLAHLRSPESISSQDHNSPGSIQSPQQFPPKADKVVADGSGREPRQCVLKLKQSRSPLAKILDHLLRSLEKRDPHQFFAWPVTNDIAPGYSAIITKPMDFSTMRQKIDENAYGTIQEFGDDFRLMCENAIKYNHVETVYHKAAKRLLHVGARMLQPENLMRSLRSFMVYMRELTSKELGFELPNSENTEGGDSADEETSTGAEEGLKDDDDAKRKPMRAVNHPKGRFEPFVDDMSPDEVLAQVQKAARAAKSRVYTRQRAHKMGFLRQHKDGTTSMNILLDTDGKCTGQERLISLGAFTGRLKQGTGQIQGMREDRRNLARTVKPLNYGAFSSFAPIFDSRFANLSKEESQLILTTYGDEPSAQYAESILEFTRNSSYASSLANGLLDVLTGGEHRKTMSKLMETQRQRVEKEEVEKSFPDPQGDTQDVAHETEIDFEKLQSLSELGIDVSFLEHMEKLTKDSDYAKKFQSQLTMTSTLLEKLHQVQYDRLSQPLPVHLSQVQQPGSDEVQLATQITSNITEMAKNLPPEVITTPHALRKAMGVSTAGLEPPLQMQRVALVGNVQGIPRISCNISPDMDITPVPMEIEPDSLVQHHNHNHSNVDNTTPVDLETDQGALFELREFLEGGSSSEVEHDTSSIEQMLLN